MMNYTTIIFLKKQTKRNPVEFNYTGLNPTFLKWLAKIPVYTNDKYGSFTHTIQRLFLKKQTMSDEQTAKRNPVEFNYTGLNPTFLKWLAKIPVYTNDKYGSFTQYTKSRLKGEQSPMNHMIEHWRQYISNEPYDHFDGDVRWHLVAIAYNAMMEFYYHSVYGPEQHPLIENK